MSLNIHLWSAMEKLMFQSRACWDLSSPMVVLVVDRNSRDWAIEAGALLPTTWLPGAVGHSQTLMPCERLLMTGTRISLFLMHICGPEWQQPCTLRLRVHEQVNPQDLCPGAESSDTEDTLAEQCSVGSFSEPDQTLPYKQVRSRTMLLPAQSWRAHIGSGLSAANPPLLK